MVSIIKLRFLLFKKDYKIVLLMMGLSLAFTFVFGTTGGNSEPLPLGIALVDDTEASLRFANDLVDTYPQSYRLYSDDGLSLAVENDDILIGARINKQEIEILKKSDRFEVIQQEIAFKNDLRTLNREYQLIDAIATITGDEVSAEQQFKNEKKYNESFGLVRSYFGVSKWANFDNLLQGILGFTLYFSTFSMVFGMGDIVEDKRLYTWHRMLTTPIKLPSIILGNLIFYSLMGIVQIAIIFGLGQVLFGVEFNGSLPAVIGVTSLYVVAMNGLGLFIASMVKDAHQLSAVSPIVLTAMAMLGGCMWPIEVVTSKILIAVSYLTPHRWALATIKHIVQFGGLDGTVFNGVIVLSAMGLLFIGLGSYKIYKKPVA